MEWNESKNKKYISGPPVTVHGYAKLTKAESPRAHASPTSILRKFPHSLRHDQKHQTKIKRNSVPAQMLISRGGSAHGAAATTGVVKKEERQVRNVKSWCLGDEVEELQIDYGKKIDETSGSTIVTSQTQYDKPIRESHLTAIHQSTPDLSEHFNKINTRYNVRTSDNQVPLKTSDSLPQLNQFRNKFLNNFIPKLNQKDDSLINKLRHIDSNDSVVDDEKTNLLTDNRKIEILPNIKSIKNRKPLTKQPIGSCNNIDTVTNISDGKVLKKCETVIAISSLLSCNSTSRLTLHVEPVKPVNRLRVPPNTNTGSYSRMCSRCSSLLSMASSSRYSINTTGSGFVPCQQQSSKDSVLLLCKLCLLEVPLNQSMEIQECGCVFCRDCMRLYAEFEIQEGAYDISCPDAQCENQGIVTLDEVEILVTQDMMSRYKRFRLNREVDLDRNRTWCPRAGCETVCKICPREKCLPASVHCPTCESDFCSNCKNPWHQGLTCEENSKKLAKEGRSDLMEPSIPFDSDVIKFCPMCNVPIEKDEGCAQMMCKRCKHVFCWYCLASLDDDFLLRHYDKGPCKNKLGHSRASVIWHRTQVIGIFAGFGILLLVASPLLLLAAPCIVCCKCRVCSGGSNNDDDLPEESVTGT